MPHNPILVIKPLYSGLSSVMRTHSADIIRRPLLVTLGPNPTLFVGVPSFMFRNGLGFRV